MKRVAGIIFAVLTMTAFAFAADDTLGTWKYNTAKAPQSTLSPIKSLTVTREAVNGGAVKTLAKGEREDGTKIDVNSTCKYDGKEVGVTGTGVPWDATVCRQVDVNTVTEERWKKGGKYHVTARLVVAADGKTMTATSDGTNSDGKTFTQVIIWDKQ